jgi:hypothetical protein
VPGSPEESSRTECETIRAHLVEMALAGARSDGTEAQAHLRTEHARVLEQVLAEPRACEAWPAALRACMSTAQDAQQMGDCVKPRSDQPADQGSGET